MRIYSEITWNYHQVEVGGRLDASLSSKITVNSLQWILINFQLRIYSCLVVTT